MRHITVPVTLLVFLLACGSALGQTLPTSQPKLIQIIIEDVKVGHEADHAKTEAGWPAAFEKAKSPYFSLGMVALTGPSVAWFVVPFDSNQAMGDSMKRSTDDPMLAAELARLSRADADHINNARSILVASRTDLSRGAFPDSGRQRFWEVTIFRVRPGHEGDFEAAAKAYGSAAARSAPNTAYRVYEVVAGLPAPTYMVFSSVVSYGDFDKTTAEGEATMKGANAEEQKVLQKFGADAVINSETQRFRLDPDMSYVPKEVRAQDPAFWMPKKPVVKKATPNQD